uniref:Cystatin kininogen-type domain-containing protein n=1 Tax=Cyclopterus lumpus TaxID=8103 RepID=A0A8C2ZA47_CYCLU
MRSSVGLCVLGLLCLHSSVFGQPGVLIFCDDPSVEKAVHSAVNKFNERLSTGHKLALFQTLTASKSENGSDSVYSLQFTSRRSDCPAGSNTPWTDCNYLSNRSKKPISCNATVYMTETEADTKQVDYHVIIPEKASCLGCPMEIDENSEDLKLPLSVSISKYNSMSDSTHLFTLHSVGHATRQVVAGFRYKMSFDMKKTTCAKTEHKELSGLCEYVNCNSTVDVAQWRFEDPNAQIQCDAGALPTMFVTKRRPPGWSPLRNFLYDVPPTATSPSSAPSTKASAKEESSEEDTTASNPFHCPSKAWKPVNAVQPAAPTKAATEEDTPKSPVTGYRPAAGINLSSSYRHLHSN